MWIANHSSQSQVIAKFIAWYLAIRRSDEQIEKIMIKKKAMNKQLLWSRLQKAIRE